MTVPCVSLYGQPTQAGESSAIASRQNARQNTRVAIVGAGVGGLAAAIDLAVAGLDVTVLERADVAGGKIRTERVDESDIDCGPTVFTMRHVFDELFAHAGASLDERITLHRCNVLARHAWSEAERLDLFADTEQSADAIATFAGPREAEGYRRFAARARRIFEALDEPFMQAVHPTPLSLVASTGIARLWGVSPFTTLWHALGEHFRDPRLRQLFGRYATYSGSSPFLAPATLMLIAHAEQAGVWRIEGGMNQLAAAMADLAMNCGVRLRYGAQVTRVRVGGNRVAGIVLASGEDMPVDAVVVNADTSAVRDGLLGPEIARATPAAAGPRSLSAVTFAMVAEADLFPLSHHNVFFSSDYEAEFRALDHGALPAEPTVYVCAQDRGGNAADAGGAERLFCILNAPADAAQALTGTEITQCESRMMGLLERCGLRLRYRPETIVATTPAMFAARFPGTNGALYGPALHSPMASFRRPTVRARLPGLYFAGGSVHPGPGVPMVARSGRTAAACLLADIGLTAR